MTTSQESMDLEASAAALLPLLVEYTDKANNIGTQARQLQQQYKGYVERQAQTGKPAPELIHITQDFEILRFHHHRLHAPMSDLSRQASQMATHAKLRVETRLQLSLRLAELEGAMHRTQQIVNANVMG